MFVGSHGQETGRGCPRVVSADGFLVPQDHSLSRLETFVVDDYRPSVVDSGLSENTSSVLTHLLWS